MTSGRAGGFQAMKPQAVVLNDLRRTVSPLESSTFQLLEDRLGAEFIEDHIDPVPCPTEHEVQTMLIGHESHRLDLAGVAQFEEYPVALGQIVDKTGGNIELDIAQGN